MVASADLWDAPWDPQKRQLAARVSLECAAANCRAMA
jgi:hypothetical protein